MAQRNSVWSHSTLPVNAMTHGRRRRGPSAGPTRSAARPVPDHPQAAGPKTRTASARQTAAVDWPINVLISSRCSGSFDAYDNLSTLRIALREDLGRATIFGKQIARITLSEDFPAGPGTESSWDDCLRAVDEADLVLVLYNGQSGSLRSPTAQVGVCHEEYRYAFERAPERVRVIVLGDMPSVDDLPAAKDKAFRAELPRSYIPRVHLYQELVRESGTAIAQAILRNFKLGLGASRRDAFSQGAALDWTRLDFATRAGVMRTALAKALQGKETHLGARHLTVRTIERENVVCVCHAVPAAMSISSARELFGQPFLRDFELAEFMSAEKATAPLHL